MVQLCSVHDNINHNYVCIQMIIISWLMLLLYRLLYHDLWYYYNYCFISLISFLKTIIFLPMIFLWQKSIASHQLIKSIIGKHWYPSYAFNTMFVSLSVTLDYKKNCRGCIDIAKHSLQYNVIHWFLAVIAALCVAFLARTACWDHMFPLWPETDLHG